MKKFVFFMIICLVIVSFSYFKKFNTSSKEISHIDEAVCIECHYFERIVADNLGKLFKLDNEKFIEVGKYEKGVVFNLGEIKDEYFNIKGTEYYVHYSNVLEDTSVSSVRYKNYINIGKIITLNNFSLYKDENTFITVNDELSFEVIYIDGNKYYILFNDELYYVLESNILSIEDIAVNSDDIASKIAVLNYHFIYDKDYETCNERICIEKDFFEEHLLYLKDNGFLTLTMNEFNLWMNKGLILPKKSVLITFDDGALGTDTHLPELLEKHNMNASLFLITAWWPKEKYESPNLEIYSHGYDIHLNSWCKNGPRGVCLSKEELINDFSLSIPLVDSNIAFCYPFYRYNNLMIEALKELDFSLAFVGGNRKAKPTDNKYLIPRYPIYKNTSIDTLKSYVN